MAPELRPPEPHQGVFRCKPVHRWLKYAGAVSSRSALLNAGLNSWYSPQCLVEERNHTPRVSLGRVAVGISVVNARHHAQLGTVRVTKYTQQTLPVFRRRDLS